MAGGMVNVGKDKYWQGLIEEQKGSGKTQGQFCHERGLVPHQFSYWKNALLKRQRAKAKEKKATVTTALPFVPIEIPDSIILDSKTPAAFAEHIDISKITVRISSSVDKSILAGLLRALDSSSC
jgi:hypothetical protein